MDTVDRIFELADQKFKEQKDFAAALGLIPQRVSAWRRRTSASYTKYLPQIAKALGTTTEYLLTGNGPKYRDQAGLFVDTSGSMSGTLTDLDLGFGETVARLNKKEPAGQMADGNVEEAARLFSKLTPQEQEFFLSQLHGVVDPREK